MFFLPLPAREHTDAVRGRSAESFGLQKTSRRPVLLSHVLLHEGRDLPGAEAALCRVLALEPGNQEARHNLEVLRQSQACDQAFEGLAAP
jgi:hypothetical protein